MEKTPIELKLKLQSGELVLFLGQEISELAGLPSIRVLANTLAKRINCPEDVSVERKLQFYDNTIGRQELVNFLKEKLDTRHIRPSHAHFLATQMPSKIIFTTSYDDLLEKAFREANKKFNRIVVGQDLPYWDENVTTIIKLYGSLDTLTNLTITQNDHFQYASKNQWLLNQLQTLLVRKTFIFLGYDPIDIIFNQLYASIEYSLKEHQRRAYMVTCNASRFDIDELSNKNFLVINYESPEHTRRLNSITLALAEYVEYASESLSDVAFPETAQSPAKRLANEVKAFLLSIGHTIVPGTYSEHPRAVEFVAKPKDDEQIVEFIAEKRAYGILIKRLYRCVDGGLGSSDVTSFLSRIDKIGASEGWIITYREGLITPQARNKANEFMNIRVMSIAGFYREMIHFEEYLDRLVKDYEESEIPSYWVNLACKVPQYDDTRSNIICHDIYEQIDDYIDSWLDAPASNHISVLGDFGTGKTWFCKKYAAKLAKLYLADPEHRRIPLLIPLREFKKITSIEDLITTYLVNKCKIDLPGGFATFQHLNRHDGLLLILDGFDEMSKSADYSVTVENFEELTKIVESGNQCKVILTCRTSYFRSNLQEREVLAGEGHDVFLDLKNRPNFDLIYLQEFDENRIKEVLQHHTSGNVDALWNKIQGVYDLPNLAQRPVLLRMIIETLNELLTLPRVSVSVLYEIYTSNWIQKQAIEDRTLINPKQKLAFMQELAWFMYERNDFSIHYTQISKLLSENQDVDLQASVDQYEHDIRSQSFLIRTSDGYYTFAHTSFMEFFVAKKLKVAIMNNDFETLGKEYVSDGVYNFLAEMLDDRESKTQLLHWLGNSDIPISTRRNCMVFLTQNIDQETESSLRVIFKSEKEISIAIRIAVALNNIGKSDLLEELIKHLGEYEKTTGYGPSKKLSHSLSIARGQNLAIIDEALLTQIAKKLTDVKNEHMIRTLILILGHSKAKLARESVEQVLQQTTDMRTMRYAIAALGRIADVKSLPILQQHLKHENDVIRKETEIAISYLTTSVMKTDKTLK